MFFFVFFSPLCAFSHPCFVSARFTTADGVAKAIDAGTLETGGKVDAYNGYVPSAKSLLGHLA
jgi:hypothetical protein